MHIISLATISEPHWYLDATNMAFAQAIMTFAQTITAVVIAVATIVNLRIAKELGDANKKSAEAAWESAKAAHQALQQSKEALEIANRPYIEIIEKGVTPDKQTLTFQVENSGNVPLSVFRIVISGETQAGDIRSDVDQPTIAPGKSSLITCAITSSDLRNRIDQGRASFSVALSYKGSATGKEYMLLRKYRYSSALGLQDAGQSTP